MNGALILHFMCKFKLETNLNDYIFIIIIQDDTIHGKKSLFIYVDPISFNILRDGRNAHNVCAESTPQISGLTFGLHQESPIKLH